MGLSGTCLGLSGTGRSTIARAMIYIVDVDICVGTSGASVDPRSTTGIQKQKIYKKVNAKRPEKRREVREREEA